MTTFTTLGSLIDGRYTVTAHCHAQDCRHSAPLDLVGLAERLGRDFVTVGDPNPLARVLKCARCGGKDLGLILHPPDVPQPASGHGLSRTGGRSIAS